MANKKMTKFIPYACTAITLLVMLVVSSPVMATITCTVSAGIAISDLSARNPKQSSIDLTWTTPETGPHAFSYFDVRYSEAIILSDNWDEAIEVTGEPNPVAGATQGMAVSDLDSNTKYYFAIKIVDVEGMVSALSNIAIGSTLAIPSTPMSEFKIDYAKLEFKKKPNDDRVLVLGELELDLVDGDGVDISEFVTVTVGPLSETITMVEKGGRVKKWQYRRPGGYQGVIRYMEINWRNGKFNIRMDRADLSGVTNPVTISIQIGDDFGEETILMREKRYYWDYQARRKWHWWEWWQRWWEWWRWFFPW